MGVSHSQNRPRARRSASTNDGYGQVDSRAVCRSSSLSECFLLVSGCGAKWSRFHPLTAVYPSPRNGHFSASYQDVVFVGCGDGENGQCFNDFWILELSTLQWRSVSLTGDEISPRTGIRGVVCGTFLWLFGGFFERTYYDDLFAINLTSFQCQRIKTKGSRPSARRAPIFLAWNNHLYVWGGYNGSWPSELHALDLETLNWQVYSQNVGGRTGTTYSNLDRYGFCYSHQSTGGIIVIDFERNLVQQVETTGYEPDSSILNAGMIAVNNRLFLIGGKAETEFALSYACDLRAMRWFVLPVMPDAITVKKGDGQVDGNGLFQVPRLTSIGVAYDQRRRRILALLGRPFKDPTPIHVFDISETLAVMNLQDDLRETLKLDILYP